MNLTLIIHISKCIRNKKVLLQGHLVDSIDHLQYTCTYTGIMDCTCTWMHVQKHYFMQKI